MTTNDTLSLDDRLDTTLLPPRNDENVAPELVIPKGYWERMNDEYELFLKEAA